MSLEIGESFFDKMVEKRFHRFKKVFDLKKISTVKQINGWVEVIMTDGSLINIRGPLVDYWGIINYINPKIKNSKYEIF
jgi:hypothetical protein